MSANMARKSACATSLTLEELVAHALLRAAFTLV